MRKLGTPGVWIENANDAAERPQTSFLRHAPADQAGHDRREPAIAGRVDPPIVHDGAELSNEVSERGGVRTVNCTCFEIWEPTFRGHSMVEINQVKSGQTNTLEC
jgi:hypothetical protein